MLGVFAFLMSVPTAHACWIESTITIVASNGSGQDIKTFKVAGDTNADGTLTWGFDATNDPTQAIAILDGSITKLLVTLDADPAVSTQFAVTAGNVTTTYGFIQGIPVSPALTNPLGYANATTSLTDNNNDGATLTGLYAGGKTYKAVYNATSTPTDFVMLASGYNAAPGTSATVYERSPAKRPRDDSCYSSGYSRAVLFYA